MNELIRKATKPPKESDSGASRAATTATTATTATAAAAAASTVVTATVTAASTPGSHAQSQSQSQSQNREFISEALLRPIKGLCRDDAAKVHEAARYLVLELRNRSWLLRVRALNVIDALFLRSRLFREVICGSVREMAEAAGLLQLRASDSTDAAPSSSSRSSSSSSSSTASAVDTRNAVEATSGLPRVAARTKELLELWDLQYGAYLPRLRAMARFLRESLKVRMPDLRKRLRERREQVQEAEATARRKLALRRNRVLVEARAADSSGFVALYDDLEKMDRYMELVFPGVTAASAAPAPAPVGSGTSTSTDGDGGNDRMVGEKEKRGPQLEIYLFPEEHPLRRRRAGSCSNSYNVGGDDGVRARLGSRETGDRGGRGADDDDADNDDDNEEDEEEEEEEDILWDDDYVDAHDVPDTEEPVDIQTLLSAVPADGVDLSSAQSTAVGAATSHNTDILIAAKDHAMHLSKSVRRTLAGWMADLRASVEMPDASEADTCPARIACSSYLRQIALLNAKLYRVLSQAGKFWTDTNFLAPLEQT